MSIEFSKAYPQIRAKTDTEKPGVTTSRRRRRRVLCSCSIDDVGELESLQETKADYDNLRLKEIQRLQEAHRRLLESIKTGIVVGFDQEFFKLPIDRCSKNTLDENVNFEKITLMLDGLKCWTQDFLGDGVNADNACSRIDSTDFKKVLVSSFSLARHLYCLTGGSDGFVNFFRQTIKLCEQDKGVDFSDILKSAGLVKSKGIGSSCSGEQVKEEIMSAYRDGNRDKSKKQHEQAKKVFRGMTLKRKINQMLQGNVEDWELKSVLESMKQIKKDVGCIENFKARFFEEIKMSFDSLEKNVQESDSLDVKDIRRLKSIRRIVDLVNSETKDARLLSDSKQCLEWQDLGRRINVFFLKEEATMALMRAKKMVPIVGA